MSINRDVRATSLRMAEPTELAGDWTVTAAGDGRDCALRFDVARVEAANAHALSGGDCLERLVGQPVAGWRPAPDGIELAGADGLTVAMFADRGDGTAALAGGAATLRRAAPAD